MKRNVYRRRLMCVTGLWYLLTLVTIAFGSDNSSSKSEQSEQWERAAVNYEWAAMAQQDAAQVMLSESKLLRDASYEDLSEYNRNLLEVAGIEGRAAALEEAAGSNFDQAAKCWKRVTNRQNVNTEQSKQSNYMANIAKQKATVAYKRAAEIYELSAHAYATAGKYLQQAGLSKKAAEMRELLAQRI